MYAVHTIYNMLYRYYYNSMTHVKKRKGIRNTALSTIMLLRLTWNSSSGTVFIGNCWLLQQRENWKPDY